MIVEASARRPGCGAFRRAVRAAALALSLALAWGTAPSPALAAVVAGGAHGTHGSVATDAALTPAEAQTLLSVLNDPAKRQQFTRTLTALLAATRAKAIPAAPAGFVPRSLGAELLTGAGSAGADLAAQSREVARTLRNFHDLGPWLDAMLRDPARRTVVIASVWRLLVVLAVALGAVLAVERAVRRPIAFLARAAGGGRAPPPPPVPEEDEKEDDAEAFAAAPFAGAEDGAPGRVPPPDEAGARRRHGLRLSRLLHALRRLPFAVAHLALELLPVIAFGAVAACFEASGFVRLTESVLVVSVATRSFIIAGLGIGLVNTALAPAHPSLRLLLLRDVPARRLARWLWLGISYGAFAFAALLVAQTLGLPPYAAIAVNKAIVLVEHTILAGLIVASRRDVARRLQPPRRVRGPVRRLLAAMARRWWLYALFFDYAFWVIWAAELRDGYARLWTFTIETVVTVAVARLLGVALLGGLERLFRLDDEHAAAHPWLRARADRYYPVVRRFITAVVALAAAITLLQLWGLHAFSWFGRGALGGRVVGAAISVLISIGIGVLVWEASNTAIDRHLDRLRADPSGGAARIARLNTLLPMLRILLFIFVATVVALTILSEIGVDVAPLLGGAGIIGVAIGFGSQKLVQDFITGIFLLLENTMQVGDTITAGGLSGAVEHLSIRTMRLRAGDGSVHIIPFSSVSTVTNTNRGLGNAAVSVDIAADEDTDRAADILKEIAVAMRADEQFGDGMRSDLQYWGVNAVSGQAVTLVGQIVCTDSGRWGVQREFNRRMRIRFAAEGVRLAVPVQHVRVAAGTPAPDAVPAPPDAPSPAGAASGDGAAGRATALTESPAPNALGNVD